MRTVAALLFFFTFFAGQAADAQEHGGVWRKRVTRNIFMDATTTSSAKWAAFFKGLVDDVEAQKIKVYAHYTPASMAYWPDQAGPFEQNPYNMIINNPGSQQSLKMIEQEAYCVATAGITVAEEWLYDPATGTTTILINKVSPLQCQKEGFYKDGVNLFWITWQDACDYARKYNSEVSDSIIQMVWNDYFNDTNIIEKPPRTKVTENTLQSTTVRKTKLYEDTVSNMDYSLRNGYDSVITEVLVTAARYAHVPQYAYTDKNTSRPLTPDEMYERVTTIDDTSMVTNPTDGKNYLTITHHDFDFEAVIQYYVDEQWDMDIAGGKTTITYTAISPVKDSIGHIDKLFKKFVPMFRIKYADARRVLKNYNEYNPTFNIEEQIWTDRFRNPPHKRKQ